MIPGDQGKAHDFLVCEEPHSFFGSAFSFLTTFRCHIAIVKINMEKHKYIKIML